MGWLQPVVVGRAVPQPLRESRVACMWCCNGWLAGSLLGRTMGLRDLACPGEALTSRWQQQQVEQQRGSFANGAAAAASGKGGVGKP